MDFPLQMKLLVVTCLELFLGISKLCLLNLIKKIKKKDTGSKQIIYEAIVNV